MTVGEIGEEKEKDDVEQGSVDVKHVEGQKPVNPVLWNLMLLAGYYK